MPTPKLEADVPLSPRRSPRRMEGPMTGVVLSRERLTPGGGDAARNKQKS